LPVGARPTRARSHTHYARDIYIYGKAALFGSGKVLLILWSNSANNCRVPSEMVTGRAEHPLSRAEMA